MRLAGGVEIPVRAPQRRRGSRQRFKEGTQPGKVPAIGILDGRFQPRLDRHPMVITYLVVCRSQITTGAPLSAGEAVDATYPLFVLVRLTNR